MVSFPRKCFCFVTKPSKKIIQYSILTDELIYYLHSRKKFNFLCIREISQSVHLQLKFPSFLITNRAHTIKVQFIKQASKWYIVVER
jgi:hypothetical protein